MIFVVCCCSGCCGCLAICLPELPRRPRQRRGDIELQAVSRNRSVEGGVAVDVRVNVVIAPPPAHVLLQAYCEDVEREIVPSYTPNTTREGLPDYDEELERDRAQAAIILARVP